MYDTAALILSVELSLLRSVFSSSGWVMIHNKSQARGASGVRVSNLVVEKIASYAQAAAVETTCSPEDANASVPDCGWQISLGGGAGWLLLLMMMAPPPPPAASPRWKEDFLDSVI
jgi:hypothetical protein